MCEYMCASSRRIGHSSKNLIIKETRPEGSDKLRKLHKLKASSAPTISQYQSVNLIEPDTSARTPDSQKMGRRDRWRPRVERWRERCGRSIRPFSKVTK